MSNTEIRYFVLPTPKHRRKKGPIRSHRQTRTPPSDNTMWISILELGKTWTKNAGAKYSTEQYSFSEQKSIQTFCRREVRYSYSLIVCVFNSISIKSNWTLPLTATRHLRCEWVLRQIFEYACFLTCLWWEEFRSQISWQLYQLDTRAI